MASSKSNQDFDVLEFSKVDVEKNEAELNLPPGVRFHPEDGELVSYLVCKIVGGKLPITDVFKEFDMYEQDPDELPRADCRHGRTKANVAYYFSSVQHFDTSEGKVTKRGTKGGYWKETRKEKEVTFGNNKVVGFKTSLLFKKGKAEAPGGDNISFVMHEYRVNPSIIPVDVLNDTIKEQIERCVVCKIVIKGLKSDGDDGHSN